MKKVLVVLAIVLSWIVNLYAEESQNLLLFYKDDVVYTSSQVSDNKQALLVFGTLFGLSLFLDKGIRDYAVNHENPTLENVADFTENFGNWRIIFPAVATLGTWGYLKGNSKLLTASVTSAESGLTAILLTIGIKTVVGRERPYGTDSPFRFKPFSRDTLYHSFPSGHTVIAWSMITPYAVYYKQPFLYLIPLSVNFARVYKNKHWLSDTVMSSGIGFAIGYFFSKRHLNSKVIFLPNRNSLVVGIRF